MKRIIIIFALLLSISAFPQYYAGEIGFNYLNIPLSPSSQSFSTAGSAALGRNGDLINPASLYGYGIHNEVSVNYMNYIAGSHFGLISYTFSGSQVYLKYFNSGLIEKRDSLNTDLGTYSANVLIANYSKSFLLNDKMRLGAGVNLGVENITEYNGIAASLDIGFIYKNIYSDFLSAGVNISNLGLVYDFDEKSMTPAKIVAGLAISKEDMPFAVYLDAGKIIDREYFYAGGMEFFLIREKKKEVQMIQIKESASNEIKEDSVEYQFESTVSDTMTEAEKIAVIDSTMQSIADASVQSPDTQQIGGDSIEIADVPEMPADTAKNEEEEYKSYADYLEDEAKDSVVINENNVIETSSEIADTANTVSSSTALPLAAKTSIMDPFAFSFRWGFSSDRNELSMGYGTDLLAGLTAGFKMSYKTASVNYSVKMWGELGVTQTIGLDFRF